MKILHYPHPVLRAKATPVTTISKEILIQAGEMLELMYAHNGLGLAAPQVGISNQIIVMNVMGKAEEKEFERIVINPVILEAKGAQINDREGCLSFPELFSNVRRFKSVKVQGYDLKGEKIEAQVTGLNARLWQHEIDHLHGHLFIDKLGPIGRMNTRKQIEEFLEAFAEAKKKGDIAPEIEMAL
jgi:peptide deformylase